MRGEIDALQSTLPGRTKCDRRGLKKQPVENLFFNRLNGYAP